jgi:hypothetical protein
MISHDDVPYSDLEPLSVLIAECRCVEGECASHGVSLHPQRHRIASSHPSPFVIGEVTRHMIDGYAEYGS